MIHKLLVAPHPILSKIADEIIIDDIPKMEIIIDDMIETMKERGGIGLAAPQIGISKRLIVINHDDFGNEPLVFINPIITELSDAMIEFEEGCLSVPEQSSIISRHDFINIKYYDRYGKEQILKADGLLARCLQHEIDHLNGNLIIDRVSKLKKDIMVRKLTKFKKKHNLD